MSTATTFYCRACGHPEHGSVPCNLANQTAPKVAKPEPLVWMMTAKGYGRPPEFYMKKPDFVPPISMLTPLYSHPPASPPSVPEGWKLLKDSAHDERSWLEDYSLASGNYNCTCWNCLRIFTGHKRRTECRVCASAPQPPPAAGQSTTVTRPDGEKQ